MLRAHEDLGRVVARAATEPMRRCGMTARQRLLSEHRLAVHGAWTPKGAAATHKIVGKKGGARVSDGTSKTWQLLRTFMFRLLVT